MGRIVLGEAGVLAPGRWRWARALGWMALLFAVAYFIAYPYWVRAYLPWPRGWGTPIAAVTTVVAYAVYAVLVRRGERRPASEIALRPLLPELLGGVAIGAGMFTLVFAVLRLSGAYVLEPSQWTDWGWDIVDDLLTGLREEFLYRLIMFRLLMRAFGLWPALAASALLFGASHFANPNAGLIPAIAVAIAAGPLFAGFYLLTGRIWLAVGVHAAWNFTQGSVFGARVSGWSDEGSLFVSTPAPGAPAWLSGGEFGPEASVVTIVVVLAVFAVVMRTVMRSKET